MEPLRDPLNDRVVKDVDPPPMFPITEELLFPDGIDGKPDWRTLKSHLLREGRVQKEHLLEIIRRTSEITANESNMLRLKDPITVVGDIHGQYYDLVKLLEVGGDPETTQYLFLGDYVDRGSFSIEVLLLLYCLKLNYPDTVYLLRGNHECRQMTTFFNFRDECEYKYDTTVHCYFMESFDTLPIAAIINEKFFCVHGGLSPELRTVDQILMINRFQEPPRSGLYCDILWADPVDNEDDSEAIEEPFITNNVRGCSYFFATQASNKFLDQNGLLSVVRAHEAQLEGFKMHSPNKKTRFPSVITIFSAPNYCDVYNNKGAILKFENNTLNIQQFNFSAHPYHLPNFLDIFSWSLPFVSEKVTEMLYSILQPVASSYDQSTEIIGEEDLPDDVRRLLDIFCVSEDGKLPEESVSMSSSIIRTAKPAATSVITKERADTLRKKVKSVARIMRVFSTLREQNELIVKLKGITPGHRIPMGLLLGGKNAIENELEKFNKAKSLDAYNERRPS
ncbi:phosphatase 2B catalytic subunit [Cryptosporidium bovis]|uniref:phosphatase 2B catalytic subunit n=1 Tax=Cryptosporidium bovis TaxID=310047 RepID=UPI00351AA93E|nr:phosphatase 2B catalytic subunit [Cryptosporidium bovis]